MGRGCGHGKGHGGVPGSRSPLGTNAVVCPQLMDLKLTVDGLEKERDFYFSKLRDIELICQEHENENSPIITGIVSVLYATEVSTEHALPVRLLAHPAPELSGLSLVQNPPSPASSLSCTQGCPRAWACQGLCAVLGGTVGREWAWGKGAAGAGSDEGLTVAVPPGRRVLLRQRTTSWRSSSQRTRMSTSPGTLPRPAPPCADPLHRHSRSESVRLALHRHAPSQPPAEPARSASSSSGGKPLSP